MTAVFLLDTSWADKLEPSLNGQVCLGLIPLFRDQYLNALSNSSEVLLNDWSAQLTAYVVDSLVPILIYEVVPPKTSDKCSAFKFLGFSFQLCPAKRWP